MYNIPELQQAVANDVDVSREHSGGCSSQDTAANINAGPVKKRLRKAVTDAGLSQMNRINHMPDFMHPYIECIVDVKSDGNCGYRAIALANRNNEDDHQVIKESMVNDLMFHRNDYLKLYGDEERLAYITNALLPPKRKCRRNSVALMEKWPTFPDMGHIVASVLGKVVVKLTKQGASETFFPLRGIPTSDPSSSIIPGHYVYVKLKDGSPIPPTSIQWRQHCSKEAIVWESYFVVQQAKFNKLMEEKMVNNKKNPVAGSNYHDPIDL